MSSLIKCPHCDKNTDPSVPYCLNCGKEISTGAIEISEKFKKSISSEQQTQASLYIRGMMVFMIFVFVATLIFAYSVSSEPALDIKPAYPIVSPDDNEFENYKPGDHINIFETDSVGGLPGDYTFSDSGVIDSIIDEKPPTDDKPEGNDDK